VRRREEKMKEKWWCGVVWCVRVCVHTCVKVSATDNTENRSINFIQIQIASTAAD